MLKCNIEKNKIYIDLNNLYLIHFIIHSKFIIIIKNLFEKKSKANNKTE